MNCVEKEYKSIITRIGFSLLFFLLLFNLLTGGTQIIGMLLQELVSESDIMYIVTDLASSLAYLFSFILPVVFFSFISRGIKTHPMNLTLVLPSPHSWLKLTAIVWAGVAVIIPMAYLNSLIFPVTADTSTELFGLDFSEPYKLVLSMISTAIVPAFAEEFLFRGMIVSNIKPYSKSAAVIISAVAFGLMHQNPMQLLYATAAGLVLGFIYVETESIWCCITLHFINNFISVMQSYFSYILGENTANTVLFFFDVFVIVGGMICAVVLLGGLKKRKREKEIGVYGVYDKASDGYSEKINFVKKGFLAPAFLIFVILCAVQSALNGIMLSTI